jgi:hypothetical protein
MTLPVHCGTCGDILNLLKAATATPWRPEERAILLARAEASIKESEQVMLLRMPIPTDLVQ